jgi:type I restriction enzyme S subunit
MSSRSGYKTTEIGEVPEEWDVAKLEDRRVSRVLKAGGTPLRTKIEFYEKGTVPFVRIQDITKNEKYLADTELRITELGLKNSSTWIVPEGSILFSMYASFGEVVINKIPVATNQAIIAIVPCVDIDLEYLYYTLKELRGRLYKFLRETTQKNLNAEVVKNLKIAVPPLLEQQEIASILSAVDDAIQKTDEIIAKTQQLKRGLMQQLLTKGIAHTKFKQTEIGEIPEEWELVRLESIVESYRNGIYKPGEFYGRGVPSVRMYNIEEGKVNTDGAPLLEVTDQELEQYSLTPGDIVINRVNSIGLVGKAGIVPETMGPATFESKNIRLRIYRNLYDPRFLSYFMNSNSWYKQIRACIKPAIAQATINQEDLNRMLVPAPPVGEQREIVDILSSVDNKTLKEKQRRQQQDRLKKGLMQVLLAGKVRVKVN